MFDKELPFQFEDFKSILPEDKVISDLPTYSEVENIYSKTSNVISHRHQFNDQLNELPSLASLLYTGSHRSKTNALSLINPRKNECKDIGYWRKLKIGIELIDSIPFSQGDIVHGRIFISNKSETAFPYLLCSVALVGSISTVHKSSMKIKCCTIQKFLSMIDHEATSVLTNIGGNDIIPSKDNDRKYLMPFTTYSTSFMFEIPKALLSSACNFHELSLHCNLLPSINFRKPDSFYSTHIKKDNSCIKDNKNIDMAITYNIEVSIIGKLSDYKEYISKDSNVLITKNMRSVLIVPSKNINYLDMATNESKDAYRKLIERIKKLISTNMVSNTTQRLETWPQERIIQSNNHSDRNIDNRCFHNNSSNYHSYVKRIFYWYTKYRGDIRVQVPKQLTFFDISSGYFYSFSNGSILCSKFFIISIELEIVDPSGGFKFSKVEKVSSELIGLTFMSKHLRIPIVISHDLLFGRRRISDIKDSDLMEENIKKPLKSLLNEIRALQLKLDNYSLIADLQSLVNLQYNYESMKIKNINSDEINWHLEENSYPGGKKENINIVIDGKIIKSIFQSSNLDQDFQSCYIGKIYYIKISIKLHHIGNIIVNIPIHIKRNIKICP